MKQILLIGKLIKRKKTKKTVITKSQKKVEVSTNTSFHGDKITFYHTFVS